jgi:hypothetical protein
MAKETSFEHLIVPQSVGRPKTEAADQPMPIPHAGQPFIHDQVAADVARRGELGRARYGTKLQAFNGRRSLQDAYEELLDGACYVLQAKTEVDAVIAAWCALPDQHRSAIEEVAPDLHATLERLIPLA